MFSFIIIIPRNMMKLRHLTCFLMLLSTAALWAQAEDASLSTGEVLRRAPMPAQGLYSQIRRAPRRAAAVTWNYPSAEPASPFAGGDGSEASPYQIATAQQLANMAWLVNNNSAYRTKYYELTDDIVLNKGLLNEDRSLAATGAAWTPIGNSSAPFKGHFNGNGHSVFGTYIQTTSEFTGLFGYVSSATIENLGVEDGYIFGCCRTGGVAGYATNSVIRCCFNTNTMYSKSSLLAGIVGNTNGSTSIEACYNAGFIYCYGQYCNNHWRNGNCVGGVAGAIDNGGSISYCYNTGSVYGGAYYASGVCNAHNSSGPTVSHCHNVGAVTCYNSNSTGAVIAASGGYGFTIKPSYSNTYALSGSSPIHQYSTVYDAAAFADGTVLNVLDSEKTWFKQGSAYPVLNYVNEQQPEVVVAEGQCGMDAWWRLTEDGELIISGNGPMFDYGEKALYYIQQAKPQTILMGIQRLGVEKTVNQIKAMIDENPSGLGMAPWITYFASIKKITVEKGITHISQGAFLMLTDAVTASIPSTVEDVGTGAFAFCLGLTDLYSYAVMPPAMTGELSEYTFCYTANTNAMNYLNPSLCTLHVSTLSKDYYAQADGWKLFTQVTNELEADWTPVLTLTDDNCQLIPETYKKGNITYTFQPDALQEGGYAAFCLPFDISLEEAEGVTAAYVPLDFSFYDSSKQQLSVFFKECTGIIEAGTPFVALLNGNAVVLRNSAETTIVDQMMILPSPFSVFETTQLGGFMKELPGISAAWHGNILPSIEAEGWQLAANAAFAAGQTVPAFRPYLTIQADGGLSVKHVVVADVGQMRGDVNRDGRVSITDAVEVVNMILSGNPEVKRMQPQPEPQ